MSDEIEIKFLCRGQQIDNLQQILSQWSVLEQQQLSLRNAYFDTPSMQFRKWKMGLRIRSSELENTQTIKTAGKVIGGIHQRPEYNFSIDGDRPDLSLFNDEIWPKSANIELMQSQLAVLFATDFVRQRWLIEFSNSTIEIAYDQGSIVVDQRSSAINEIELELISGNVDDLFLLADSVALLDGLRLSNVSKAQRGYALAAQSLPVLNAKTIASIPLQGFRDSQSVDKALLERCFSTWQYNENAVAAAMQEYGHENDSNRVSHQTVLSLLQGLQESMQACALCLSLLPNDKSTQETSQQLTTYLERFHVINDAQQYWYLIENQEYLFRGLSTKQHLNEIIEQRLLELDLWNKTTQNIYSTQHCQLVLAMTKLIYSASSQTSIESVQESDFSVTAYLSSLQSRMQSRNKLLSDTQTQFSDAELFASQLSIKDSLILSQLSAAWFDDAQVQSYLLSWQDVLAGIEELVAYQNLQDVLGTNEEDKKQSSTTQWYQHKHLSLQKAVLFSRQQAVLNSNFWI
ncbi:CYTH domain-containing protein [Alginatibacterium sediminis]|nr:CYTH domain-containing protein [Alginatibacterium sediminis]